MDHRELVNLGLTEKEAKVYLASLELGQDSVQEIAKKAGIKRPTAYVVIKELMQKGLMSSITQDNKQYFFAESPEKLNILFREEEQRTQRKKEYLESILPEIKSIDNSSKDKPVVRYFSGKEGIINMINEFLQDNSKIARMAYSVDNVNRVFTEKERQEARNKRIKRNTKTKVIYTYRNGFLKSTKDGERKKVPFNKFPIECDIAFYQDKIRLASLDRMVGVVIEDKDLAKSLKAIFDLAWIGADELENKESKNKKKRAQDNS